MRVGDPLVAMVGFFNVVLISVYQTLVALAVMTILKVGILGA